MEITVLEAACEEDEQENEVTVLAISKTISHSIDRHIVTIDEKYLRRCLELIYLTASVSNPSSWEYSPTMTTLFPYNLQKPSVESIIGSITRSKSILNILKNPLIHDQCVLPAIESSSSSISSRSSTYFSDRITNGVLHVKWESGALRYEFSLDDRKEAAYVAKLVKPDQSPADCIYVFRGNQSAIVGRMRASSSVKLGFKETEFVLYGTMDEDEIVKKVFKKFKGFPSKLVEAFRRGPEPNPDSGDGRSRPEDISENHFSPNLELAAIVINERSSQEVEKKGWGMKFLKKTNSSTIDIVIASGIHGGPKGGPSGLIERWRSSGHCDCGGWDVGCPFKLLQARKNKNGDLHKLDLLLEGSTQIAMKMVTVSDKLYLIDMESSLSVLQSFAIAISIIHDQNQSKKEDSNGEKID